MTGPDGDVDFTLPNGGKGPDPFTLSTLDTPLAAVVFHRDYYAGNCRTHASRMTACHDEFRRRNIAVVTVLPEPEARASKWADRREAPFPVLADPDNAVADRYGQPTSFGFLGRRIDLIGRLPLVALVDLRGPPAILWTHTGTSAADYPTVDDVLAEAEKFA